MGGYRAAGRTKIEPRRTLIVAQLFLLLVTCGCANRSFIALVPDPGGKVGSISVSNESGSVAISAPYQATTVTQQKEAPSQPTEVGKRRLEGLFADALAVQPQQPLHFKLYFEKETTLTAESMARIPEVVAAIAQRHSTFVSVLGYTDTLGERGYNEELAHERARLVKELLVKHGVDRTTIKTRAYGEKVLLVPTRDKVYEPGNRAVDVVVR